MTSNSFLYWHVNILLGIIDTRPLDQRTNYISFASLTNNVTSNFNIVTVNDTPKENVSNGDSNKNSNTYQLKNNQINNNFSNFNSLGQQRLSGDIPVAAANTSTNSLPSSSTTSGSQPLPNIESNFEASCQPNLQLYENVKIKSGKGVLSLNTLNNNSSSHGNVPYENINLEYINRLMNEGYSRENVVAALGISRNNFEMACDILHEFVSTNNQVAPGKVCMNDRWVPWWNFMIEFKSCPIF